MRRFLICLLALLLASVPGFAAIVDVEAENVEKKETRVEAFGNVVVSGDDVKLRANYVIYDTATDDLWAVGDCKLQEKSGEISAEVLYYNVKRKDFHLENGSVFIYAQPVIISGRSITRYGVDQYEGEGIEFTPCLGVPPAWSLAAGSFEAPLEKYGNATNVKFQVRQFPVFYFPYLYFPVKLQRQSGFLMPSLSHATDYGYRVSLPYYQVLGRSSDATLTPNLLTSRGLLLSGEYRYRLDTQQYGEFYGEVLPSDSKGGDTSTGTILPTVPDSRWLFRSFQTGGKLTWDVKLVSNPDYFRDIGSLYPNENIWRDTITTSTGVGRSLEELVSRGQWANSSRLFSTNVSGVWKQDLTVMSNSETLQEIPRVTLRMNQQHIPGSPAFISSELNTSYLYSRDWIQEFKDNGQVKMFVPLTWFPYFTLMPSYTQYYRDAHITSNPRTFQDSTVQSLWAAGDPSLTAHYNDNVFLDNNPGLFGDNSYQELWARREISLSTTLYSSRFLDGLYHQVAPVASWTYFSRLGGNYDTSDVNDIFPQLLPEDVWQQQDQLTLGLDNYIRDRNGAALVQFSLSRVYDYLLKQWDYYEANIVIAPVPWFSLRHLNRFGTEPHPYATIEHWTKLTITDPRGDELYASEEFNNGSSQTNINTGVTSSATPSENALLGVKAVVVKGLVARSEISYDFLLDRYIRSRQGVTYTSQCWSLDFYRDVDTSDITLPRDTTVGVTVNLLGLGQVLHTERSVTGQGGQ
jgi:hypothetical protein